MKRFEDLVYKSTALVIIGLIIAVVVRWICIPFVSDDYLSYLSKWYDYIKAHQGFYALRNIFSDYNSPYLYLLASITYLPIEKLISIKLVSCLFDFIAAAAVYKLVKLKCSNLISIYAGLAVLLMPTIFVNSALWAQSDMTYSSMVLWALYFLAAGKGLRACAFYGLAIAFKLQAVFIFPVFFILLARRELTILNIVAIPCAFLLTLVPNWLIGGDARGLLGVYLGQISNYPELSLSAPNIYQWFLHGNYKTFRNIGLVLTGVLVVIASAILYRSEKFKEAEKLLSGTLAFSIIVPYFLPKMHERYFFLADVLSLVFAFYLPRFWYLPVLIGGASLLSYFPFLFGVAIVDLRIVSLIMGGAMIVVVGHVLKAHPGKQKSTTIT